MRKRNIVIGLIFLMLIATFAITAPKITPESAVGLIDDSVITTKVKALLAKDDFKSFQIGGKHTKGPSNLAALLILKKLLIKRAQLQRAVKGVNIQ